MNQAREAYARNVTGTGVNAVEVPAGLPRFRKVLVQKTTTVLESEDSGEPPLGVLKPADIVDIDHKKVTWLGALHAERSTQIVHLRQIDIPDIVGRLVVMDLATSPVVALDAELVAGLERFDDRNVRMPSVVCLHILIFRAICPFRPEIRF